MSIKVFHGRRTCVVFEIDRFLVPAPLTPAFVLAESTNQCLIQQTLRPLSMTCRDAGWQIVRHAGIHLTSANLGTDEQTHIHMDSGVQ